MRSDATLHAAVSAKAHLRGRPTTAAAKAGGAYARRFRRRSTPFHHKRGRVRARIPPVKLVASAITIGTGRSNRSAAGGAAIPAGANALAMPSTDRMLKMQLPTTLPIAMSRSPRRLATAEAAISGSEVPTAITVRPIIRSLTPSARATATAPSTSQRAPRASIVSPRTISLSWMSAARGGSRRSLPYPDANSACRATGAWHVNAPHRLARAP